MIEELNYVYIDENSNTWDKKKFSRKDAEIFSHFLVENDSYMCEDCTYCSNCIACRECTACTNCRNCNRCDSCENLEDRGYVNNGCYL